MTIIPVNSVLLLHLSKLAALCPQIWLGLGCSLSEQFWPLLRESFRNSWSQQVKTFLNSFESEIKGGKVHIWTILANWVNLNSRLWCRNRGPWAGLVRIRTRHLKFPPTISKFTRTYDRCFSCLHGRQRLLLRAQSRAGILQPRTALQHAALSQIRIRKCAFYWMDFAYHGYVTTNLKISL